MPAVLDRSELEASPLADLHAIADQLGLDGFRRLRKADLIDAILGEPAPRAPRGSLERTEADAERPARAAARGGALSARGRILTRASGRARRESDQGEPSDAEEARLAPKPRARKPRAAPRRAARAQPRLARRAASGDAERDRRRAVAEGIVEVLGNGSAFLRIDPPEPSDGDVYISAAQVRRCELVSGDRVSGPARTPRRSERYPSLVRIDTINGDSADTVSAGTRYEDLPVDYPSERIALDSKDATLEAIEWLTPFGRGSRVTIVGAPRAGKTETLRALLTALAADQKSANGGSSCRWCSPARARRRSRSGSKARRRPVAALSFAASVGLAEPGRRARDRRRPARRRARRAMPWC